ncbi:MAG: homocysteine S-methyltransferase family protein [Candidatus Heimdallarchaeota archaeon]|nr:homocysteine S-methyltransferase family protein [Candidatus Heimdallarchaeota archaeon]MDH5645277.1 homocysteine S-methyltransferase family protein [Candidatus Heimdallarchaeota archaeon]
MNIESKLTEIMKKRILIIDGGMGTMIQRYNLRAEDFGGEQYEGCTDYLVETRPDVISEIHDEYLKVGSDIIETNTFGATSIVLGEYGLSENTYKLNLKAAKLAKEAAAKYENRFVAGSMGPTTKSIVVTQDITFDEMRDSYYPQALGLLEGGVDLFLIETAHDTLNIKAAYQAVKMAEEKVGIKVPILLSTSIAMAGRMLAGQDIDAFFSTINGLDIFAIGMNCAVGPKDLHEPLNSLNQLSEVPIFIFPNAGLPNDIGEYDETPEEFASQIGKYAEAGLLNLAGGCCGTTPEHIIKVKEAVEGKPPRQVGDLPKQFTVAGVDRLVPDDKIKPIVVGERSNVQGSRRFRELIRGGQFEEALEVSKQQVSSGSQILDICLEDTEFNEIEAINTYFPLLSKSIKLPLMIDSTSPDAVEAALKHTQGKAIINSINLESGFEKLERLIGIMKDYNAAAVVGLIDEIEGMALTLEKKKEVTTRFYDLLVNKYGIPPEDIIFDMLVFTVDSGNDEKLKGTSRATIDSIKWIKETYPQVSTILGISNVSFGLPPAGREVLNSVFFYHCVQAGLDLAIVNPATLMRYNTIPPEEIKMAEEILNSQSLEALTTFSNHFRDRDPSKDNVIARANMTPSESLESAIVNGTKTEVISDLDELLETMTPLEIINTVIMRGMGEVGILFEQAKMIVTEVLQSAEVVKLAISHLEPLMLTGETFTKKKVLLATVKGDVHDIGKNLVRIILESNGYAVVDLGIRIDSTQLIRAIQEHKPDAVGLSGLLVKSSRYMVSVAEHFKEENIDIPLLVGGAALTPKFVENEIKPAALGQVHYARDAMAGLSIVNMIFEEA